jgi:DNA-damage-inducible protein J
MPRKQMAKESPAHPRVVRPSTAAKTGMIRARISPELKAQAESILAEIGLSSSDAIRMFYKQVTLRNGLPFEARIPNATTRKALRDVEAGRGMTNYASVDEMFIETLCARDPLEPRHRDHPLIGEWKGWRDCYIEPDWILIDREKPASWSWAAPARTPICSSDPSARPGAFHAVLPG